MLNITGYVSLAGSENQTLTGAVERFQVFLRLPIAVERLTNFLCLGFGLNRRTDKLTNR